MRNKILLLCVILPNLSYAAMGLNTFSKDYKLQEGSESVVTNMPKIRSQDTLGICYSLVTTTLLDEANCVAYKKDNCAEVPPEELTSSLDVTRFAAKVKKGDDDTNRFNYEGLNIEGGSQSWTLHNAMHSSISNESCAPFDQVLSKVETPAKAQELEIAMWQRFQNAYESFKKKSVTCVNCGLEYATAVSKELAAEFNLKSSNKDILAAFTQDSYSKFLDKLLIPDACWDFENTINLKGNWIQKGYPSKNDKVKNYSGTISKIKEILGKKRPIGISFCTQTPLTAKKTSQCGTTQNGKNQGEGHAVVIKGYRKVCNTKNECRDSVQVQNSWGQSWQNSNDDGWVDAKELIDRTFYEDASLVWLEKE